jgi:hypothetical protein
MMSWRRSQVVVAAFVLAFALAPQARADKKGKMPEPDPFGRFTVDQVERRLGQPNVHVFDGNPAEIYAENHVPGAVHLNSKDIKEGVLPADKNATLIFYCMNEL